MRNYDLGCILPLYGANSPLVSDSMVKKLLSQKVDDYKVKYVIFFDNTVPSEAIVNIMNHYTMYRNPNISLEIHYTAANTASGYKRNLGVQYCQDCKYLWFLDQDDDLLYGNVIEKLLSEIYKLDDIDVVRLSFTIPKSLEKIESAGQIFTIPTMPWQYIFRSDSVADYKFDETREYGSDIPFIIYYLIDHKYMKLTDETGTLTYDKKTLITIHTPVYYYNYLNPNSCLGQNNAKLNEFAVDVRPFFRKKMAEVAEREAKENGDKN